MNFHVAPLLSAAPALVDVITVFLVLRLGPTSIYVDMSSSRHQGDSDSVFFISLLSISRDFGENARQEQNEQTFCQIYYTV
jgi:hypothetical protein